MIKARNLLPMLVGLFVVMALGSLLLAEPTTKPAGASDPNDPDLDNAIIRLPDGREISIGELQREGGAGVAMVRSDGSGTTTTAIDDAGRRISITDNADGITVKVKDPDHDPVEYHAASEDELKQNQPEAYELYEKYSHKEMLAGLRDGGAGAGIDQQRIMIRTGHGDMPPMMAREIESLGISGRMVSDPFTKSQLGGGAIVVRVSKDSRGERLGLQRHDLIKSVNGQPFATFDDLQKVLEDASDKVQLEVVRGGEKIKLEEK